ncbi:unnamed protein product [Lathyrus oleraceus]
MVRRKVKLAYITNQSRRRATFRKRTKGMMKKINELSTLCGIDACAIIFDENYPEPEVWPSTTQVRSVLSRYMSLSELERSKKMLNLETYLMQTIEKAQELLKKQMEDNQKKEIANLIDQFIHTGEYNIGNVNLNDVTSYIDKNLKEIEKRIDSMEIQGKKEVGN